MQVEGGAFGIYSLECIFQPGFPPWQGGSVGRVNNILASLPLGHLVKQDPVLGAAGEDNGLFPALQGAGGLPPPQLSGDSPELLLLWEVVAATASPLPRDGAPYGILGTEGKINLACSLLRL